MNIPIRIPANMDLWQGRVDALEGELAQRWHQVVQPLHDDEFLQEAAAAPQGSIALVGFSSDVGVARNHGRVGASAAPNVLRQALSNLPVQAQGQKIMDAGNVACHMTCDIDELELGQQAFGDVVAQLLQRNYIPIGLGGGHEIAYASFRGWSQYIESIHKATNNQRAPNIGIINLDAHFDLRKDTRASSGTPFLQIAQDCSARGWAFNYCCLGVSEFANTQALFSRANELKVFWRLDTQMREAHIEEILAQLAVWLAPLDAVYLTIDLDVLPASVAPGVSAPAPMGVELIVIEAIINAVCASGKLALADIAEFNPKFDIDGHSARVAARLIARIADNLTHQTQRT